MLTLPFFTAAVNTNVGQILASDRNTNQTLTYSIFNAAPLTDLFKVDRTNGQIKVNIAVSHLSNA